MTDTDPTAGGFSFPIGTILAFALAPNSLPPGWLPCDGAPVPPDRALASLMSNTPNLIGRTLIGDGRHPGFVAIQGTRWSLEVCDTGGEWQHTLTEEEMPTHSHIRLPGGRDTLLPLRIAMAVTDEEGSVRVECQTQYVGFPFGDEHNAEHGAIQ